jgi:hypothetical protein
MTAEKIKFNIDSEFIATHDSHEVIEPLWWSVSIYDGLKQYEKDLSRFSREQRLIFACHWYMAEVNNGGHDQFYSNSTGIVWRDAMDGFIAVGKPEVAKIIQDSARRMGDDPSFDREERNRTLEALRPDFDDLDTLFYKVEDELDVDGALTSYVRRNAKAFLFSGEVTKP